MPYSYEKNWLIKQNLYFGWCISPATNILTNVTLRSIFVTDYSILCNDDSKFLAV